ncbi:MAG: NPCBM/NEW2 domain-containing protein, partial [Phycisphaerales bacterium]|nr:NPCBM/NEW2 domain-containing protein [Phycisphaerales bacterium]
ANVVVRVRLDDHIAYEQADVTAASPPLRILLPLAQAKTLTLEVDYGKTYDVQDQVIWVEPALVRSAPASQPAP